MTGCSFYAEETGLGHLTIEWSQPLLPVRHNQLDSMSGAIFGGIFVAY
jgi:hypothetical protein